MRTLIFSVCAVLLASFSSCKSKDKAANATEVNNQEQAAVLSSDTVNFHFATLDEAKKLVAAEDNFTKSWSEFDIVSRLNDPKGTKEQLKEYEAKELREWTDEEKQTITNFMYKINQTIRDEKFQLPFPQQITLVKSTLKDEGSAAGYTRENWIALYDQVGKIDEQHRQELILHELFHILTRHTIGFKRMAYSTIGFEVAEQELEYPAELQQKRITNPDIAKFDSYATFNINDEQKKCAMVLYHDRPYTEGRFFEYVKVGFVPYGEDFKAIRNAEGKVVVYDMKEVKDFFDKVGKNTGYIIHPEEILAENFVIAFLNQDPIKTPELRERLRKVLKADKK